MQQKANQRSSSNTESGASSLHRAQNSHFVGTRLSGYLMDQRWGWWGTKVKRPLSSWKCLLEAQASGRGMCSWLICLLVKSRKGQGYEQRRFSSTVRQKAAVFPEAGRYGCCDNKSSKKKKKALKSQKQVYYGVKINSSQLQLLSLKYTNRVRP